MLFLIAVFVVTLQSRDLIDPRIDMTETKRTTLSFLSPLYKATSKGDLQEVQKLIEEGANPLDEDENNDTVLHYAGKLDILKYLIEDVGCNPATEGWLGSTTLHSAAAAKQLPIVKYLIEQCQLDPSVLDDENYRSPLVYACRSGDLNIVRYLIECMRENTMTLDDIFNVPNSQKNLGLMLLIWMSLREDH